jgi:hypothetical protein
MVVLLMIDIFCQDLHKVLPGAGDSYRVVAMKLSRSIYT